MTAENYAAATDLLTKRFGRPESISVSHIKKLLQTNLSSPKDSSSPQNLWRLHDEIQTRVRSLQQLGVSGETYGGIIILHQLPTNIRLEWARVGEGHEGDLEFLLAFIFEENQRRERSQTFGSGQVSAATTSGGGQPARGQYQRRNFGTASAVLAGGQQTRLRCVFCGCTHYSDKCIQLKDVDLGKRKELVRNMGLCFRCLGHHVAKNCSKTCYFCHHNHHSVLCPGSNIRSSVLVQG